MNITRWDLLIFNLLITPRLRSTWIVWSILVLLFALVQLRGADAPLTSTGVAASVIPAVLGATALHVFGLVFSVVYVLLVSSTATGVLGQHTYFFEPAGLREQTVANDNLLKWGGARDARRVGPFILIGVAPALFHILPRRCFASSAEYDAFWNDAQRLTSKGAAQRNVAAAGGLSS